MAAPLNTTNTEAIDLAAEAAVQAFYAEDDAYLDDHDLARSVARRAVVAELCRLAEAYEFTHGIRPQELRARADELDGGVR